MKIGQINQYQQNQNINKRAMEPSFQANLKASQEVKKIIAENLSDFYSKCSWLDKKIYFPSGGYVSIMKFNKYMMAVEKATKDIKGTIRIVLDKQSTTGLSIHYTDGHNKLYKGSSIGYFNPKDILPNRLFSLKHPMKHAVVLTKMRVSEILKQNGQLVNPFMESLNKTYKK